MWLGCSILFLPFGDCILIEVLNTIYAQEPFTLVTAVVPPKNNEFCDFCLRTVNYQKIIYRAPPSMRPRILKFRFTSKMVALVFSFEAESLRILDYLVKYNTNTRILFISANMSGIPGIIQDHIRVLKYSRAMLVDLTSSSYTTFEFFPSFNAIPNRFHENTSLMYKRNLNNLHKHEIKVGHVENAPRGMKYNDAEGNVQLTGYVANMLKVFCERINGSFTHVLIEDSMKDLDKEMLNNGEIDFITTYYNFASRNRSKFYENLQNVSDTLELVELTIITPTPKEIAEKYYTIKPFKWRIWLILVALWIYSAGLLSIVLKLTTGTAAFGSILGLVERAFLSQAFQYLNGYNFHTMNVFYMLIIVFGFIANLLYSALLGSFLVTQLKEEPINTIEDFMKNQKSILLARNDYNMIETIFDMDYFGQVFVVVERAYLRYHKNVLDPKYSYAEKTDHWKYFAYPLMDFHNDFRFRLTNIKLNVFNFYLNINADSLYKENLNRFIYLVRDVGLYQFWCGNAFLDNMRYNLYPFTASEHHSNIVDSLGLDYFEWIFSAFFGALAVSVAVFFMELTLKTWKTRTYKFKKVFNVNFYF